MDYLLSQAGQLLDVTVTKDKLAVIVYGDQSIHPNDCPWSRFVNFEDFVDILSSVIGSDLWIYGSGATNTDSTIPTTEAAAEMMEEVKGTEDHNPQSSLQHLQTTLQTGGGLDSQSSAFISPLHERLLRYLK